MDAEVELLSDGDGVAVFGNSADVERFLLSSGLGRVPSRDLDLGKLRSTGATVGAVAQVGADLAANSGRWVKLTAESAEAVKKFGLMPTKTPGVSHAMIGEAGDIKKWLQIAQAPSALISGPFALTALSTMMQQHAMQQQMNEIVDYLKEINEKVDDILRGQKDSVLADMIGVDLIIEEALTVRDHVGRVSDVTWSKVEQTGMAVARTQAYALRQLDAIAEKLRKKADLGQVAKATKDAEPKVREWLAVLARTFQLSDAISVLELDRVLDAAPEELDSHRLGLATARKNRLELIDRSTQGLLQLMHETVAKANSKVLLNPFDSPAAVRVSNEVTTGLTEFRARLGIGSAYEKGDAKRWSRAAAEVRDKVVTYASEGVSTARHFGADALSRAAERRREGDDAETLDKSRAAAERTGKALKGRAIGVADTVGGLFNRNRSVEKSADAPHPVRTESAQPPESPSDSTA